MNLKLSLLAAPVLLLGAAVAAPAQYHHDDHQQFYNGVRSGGHGDYDHDRNHHYDDHQGGIGPGKGALIGGAGGAVLGAVFGGGLKGTLIGGAAGAGIGAVVGKEHQDNVRRNDYRR